MLALRPLLRHFRAVAAGSFLADLRWGLPAEFGSRFHLPFVQITVLVWVWVLVLVCVCSYSWIYYGEIFIYDLFERNYGMVVNRKAARDLKLSWDFVIFVHLEEN